MHKGLLIYEKADSEYNQLFINDVMIRFKKINVQFELIYPEQLNCINDYENISVIWNRTRNYKITEFFEQKGIFCINNSLTNQLANNKWLTYEFFKAMNLNCANTHLSYNSDLPFPVVIKPIDGHGGKNVSIINSFEQFIHFEQQKTQQFIYQQFIPSKSRDVRVWVVGDQIAGAVLRTGMEDFRSNYTLGGKIEKFIVPEDIKGVILNIQQKLQSCYIGIDFLISEDGSYYINEIEDPVGARSFYNLYDENILELLLSYIKNVYFNREV